MAAPPPFVNNNIAFDAGDLPFYAANLRIVGEAPNLNNVVNPATGFDDAFNRLVGAVNAANVAPPSRYPAATLRLQNLNAILRRKIDYIQRRLAYYYTIEGKVPGLIEKLDKARLLFEAAILKMQQAQAEPAGGEAFDAAVNDLLGVADLIDAIPRDHMIGPGLGANPGDPPVDLDVFPAGNGQGPGGGAGAGGGDGGGGGAPVDAGRRLRREAPAGRRGAIHDRGQLIGPGPGIQGAPPGAVRARVKQIDGLDPALNQFPDPNVGVAVQMDDMAGRPRIGSEGSGSGSGSGSDSDSSGGRKRKSKRASKRKMKKTKTKKSRKGSRKQRGGFRYVTKPKTMKRSASSSSSSTSSTMSSARN